MNTKKIKDARRAVDDLKMVMRLPASTLRTHTMLSESIDELEGFIKWAEAEHATNVQNAQRLKDNFFKNHPGAADMTKAVQPLLTEKPPSKAEVMKAAEAMVAPVKADERICYYCKGTKRLQSLVSNTSRECVYCTPC